MAGPVPPSESATKYPVAGAADKHKVSSGAIAGIAVAAIVFVICAILTLFWQTRRRRGRLHYRVKVSDAARGQRTISPFMLLAEASPATENTVDADWAVHRIGTSTLARERLQTQLRAAATKIVELEKLAEGGVTNGLDAGGTRGPVSVSVGSASAPPPDLEAELRSSREQISMLVARMNAMDAAWRMGMEVELPPEYA
ncbi:hypothetical protein MSAN_01094400 [Mycena sanguinolenta]|uniref:Uncharacterized protein n=1 Tax=Mycena sanguinolenta TaxID=230812 RepID=A0A8H6YU29_9AGAR|nr:hypothetical protein MSAN_01094400 [Mycena sanguinolenta]